MTRCPYCQLQATLTIVSNPGTVCLEHAREFWTGLLDYACDRNLRARAIAAAGPPPRDDDRGVIAAPSQPAAAHDGLCNRVQAIEAAESNLTMARPM